MYRLLSRLVQRTLLSGQTVVGKIPTASRRFGSDAPGVDAEKTVPQVADQRVPLGDSLLESQNSRATRLGIYFWMAKVVGATVTLANGIGYSLIYYVRDNSILHSFWHFGPGCVFSIPKGLVMGATWPLTLANVVVRLKNWYLTDDPCWMLPLILPYFGMFDEPMSSVYLLGFDSVVSTDRVDLEHIWRKRVAMRAARKEREAKKYNK